MPKTKVDDWSTTAASNTDIGGISIQGTAPRSNFDNALREVVAQIAATPLAEAAADMRTNLSVQTQTENDARYLKLTGGTVSGSVSLTAPAYLYNAQNHVGFAPAGDTAFYTGYNRTGAGASIWYMYADIAAPTTHSAYVTRNAGANGSLDIGVIGTGGLNMRAGTARILAQAGGNPYLYWQDVSGNNYAQGYVDISSGNFTITNSYAGKSLVFLGTGELYYAGVKIANADGSLVNSNVAPTAGNVVCCVAPASAKVSSTATTYGSASHKFCVTVAGTVRARVSQAAANALYTAYVRILKNGTQVAEWSTTSTTYVERTTDIVVAVGDTITTEVKSAASGTAYAKDAAISAAAFVACATGG